MLLVTRAIVADVVATEIRSPDLKFSEVTDGQKVRLEEARPAPLGRVIPASSLCATGDGTSRGMGLEHALPLSWERSGG